MVDNNGIKPTLGDSLKTIGGAISGEVSKHGGVKGLAGELFDVTKDAVVRTGDAITKVAVSAAKHVDNAGTEFARKYNDYVAAGAKDDDAKDATATDDAKTATEDVKPDDAVKADGKTDDEILNRLEKDAKLDAEEQYLRARLAEIQKQRNSDD